MDAELPACVIRRVARVYREFRRKSHSLMPITRVRSLAFDRRPIVKSRKQIAERVVIETDSRKEVLIRSFGEYIWGLKILPVIGRTMLGWLS